MEKKDRKTDVQKLKNSVKEFCVERNWDQYHGAKDLAIGIITEASELLEHFRFKSEDEVEALFKDPRRKARISEEVADVLFFVLRLTQRYEIDLSSTLENKIEKNKRNYPVEKARGSNKKYKEL